MSNNLIINSDTIRLNYEYIRTRTDRKIIAVVKENGYGLGIENIYKILKDTGVDMYAVTDTDEALRLRAEGCKRDILMLTPVSDFYELCLLLQGDVIVALGNEKQIPALKQAAFSTGVKARVHIQIDTGLGRYGFSPDKMPDLCKYKNDFSFEGCFSHLAGSRSDYKKSIEKQVREFKRATEKIKAAGIDPGICHLASSKATVLYGDLGFDAVRVGSALLGKVPYSDDLKDAIWLESQVFCIYDRKKGQHIGYNGEAVLKRDSRLAIVRLGTGSGVGLTQRGARDYTIKNIAKGIYRRIFSRPVMTVLINGKKCPVIGRMGVSHMTVDVTDCPVNEGDMVKMYVNPIFIHPGIERVLV